MTDDLSAAQRILSRQYLTYSFLTQLYFQSAVWLFFYRLFMSDYQLGILDGITFAIGLVAEVPSGVLADTFGRSRIAQSGHFMNGIGLVLLATASSQTQFLAAMTFHIIGAAFVSGADQALFFDKLGFEPESLHWRRLVTRGAQVGLIASVMATVIGGWLHTLHPRIPYLLTAIAFFAAYGLLRLIPDLPSPDRTEVALIGIKHHTREMFRGFAALLTPALRLYVPLIIVVQGLFYATEWGMFRVILLDRFHFNPFAGSVVLGSVSLLTIAILSSMHRFAETLHERQIFIGVSLTTAISLLLSICDVGNWGWIIIFVLYAGDLTLRPVMSESINAQVKPENRATMLSVASFARNLTYVALAPMLGFLNTQGKLDYFLFIWPILIVAALVVYLRSSKMSPGRGQCR